MKSASLGSWLQRLMGFLLLLLFLLALGLQTLSGAGNTDSVEKSVMSMGERGRRAALLVLRELEMPVLAWRQAPVFLPRDSSVLWMSRVPIHKPLAGTTSESGTGQDPRSPIHYGEFVRTGGTLVLPYAEEHLAWLRDDAGLDVPDWEGLTKGGTVDIQLVSGDDLRITPQVGALALDSNSEEKVLLSSDSNAQQGWFDFAFDRHGLALISWESVGLGKVVFLGTDGWLDNDAIREEDNAYLLVRLAQALQVDAPFLFDEFALGLWAPSSKFELMTSPGLLSASLHLLLVALIFILLYAWVREFPRDPQRPRLDPRMRVQAQVALFERAQRYDLLALDLQLGVLERLRKHLGLRSPEFKLAGRQRVQRMLEQVATRLSADLLATPWERLFSSTAPSGDGIQSKQALEALGRDLRAFEDRVQVQASSR